MFVTLQGENYTVNLYLFLAIYPLYHKENSEKFESQFQCYLKFGKIVGSTFNSEYLKSKDCLFLCMGLGVEWHLVAQYYPRCGALCSTLSVSLAKLMFNFKFVA